MINIYKNIWNFDEFTRNLPGISTDGLFELGEDGSDE